MKIWVVKCRLRREDGTEGWHWRDYLLDSAGTEKQGFQFGGTDWIKSHGSRRFIEDDVEPGDLVICYQVDGQQIYGLSRMKTKGLEDKRGSGQFCQFYLAPKEAAFRFNPPIRIAMLRANGASPEAFGPGTQGTVFPVSNKEFAAIIRAMKEIYTVDSRKLSKWLTSNGWSR